MPYIALFTLITVIAASRAKAIPIDDFSFNDNQLSQLLAFNDLPSWQDPTLLNDAATQIPQFLALDPCADPNVISPPNCPVPKSSAPASEEVQPPPTINTYGGSIQDVPMEYPWNICGGRNPEPRPIATCSSGNPQDAVFEKANDDSSASNQLLQSFICESISSNSPPFFFFSSSTKDRRPSKENNGFDWIPLDYPPPDMGCPNNDAELWCCWQFVYEEPAVKFSRGTGLNCINTNHMFRDITADVFPNHHGYGVWPGMKYVPVYKPGDPDRPSGNYPQSPRA